MRKIPCERYRKLILRGGLIGYHEWPRKLSLWTTYFEETLEGSFSAVSTPIFATEYSFCRGFRNLQDLHSFAPLQIQKLHKLLSRFNDFQFLLQIVQFLRTLNQFRRFFMFCLPILITTYRKFANFSELLYPMTRNSGESQNFDGFGVRGLPKKFKWFRKIPFFSDLGVPNCLQLFQGSFGLARRRDVRRGHARALRRLRAELLDGLAQLRRKERSTVLLHEFADARTWRIFPTSENLI